MPKKITLEKLAEMLQAQFIAMQEQFDAMNLKLDQKADKSDIANLQIQLDQKADKEDVRILGARIDRVETRLDRIETVLEIEHNFSFPL